MKKNKIIESIIFFLQLLIFYFFYYFFFLFKAFIKKKVRFVIGIHEIAKTIYFLHKALRNSISVCLTQSKYYDLKYDYSNNINNSFFRFIYKIIYGPFLLSYLINKADVFIYIWSEGFLLNREF